MILICQQSPVRCKCTIMTCCADDVHNSANIYSSFDYHHPVCLNVVGYTSWWSFSCVQWTRPTSSWGVERGDTQNNVRLKWRWIKGPAVSIALRQVRVVKGIALQSRRRQLSDWHELMILQRTMRPSIARISEQLDRRFAAIRHTTAPIGHTRFSPRVNTTMGDCLRAGKPSRYVTIHSFIKILIPEVHTSA